MMIPTAEDNFMIPALTKPTTITVVAEDDWITAVTPAPNKTAFHLLFVSLSSSISNLPPDALESPLPITSMPYKKNASPPAMVRIPKKSIMTSHSAAHCSRKTVSL
jgi:hypothetical protein